MAEINNANAFNKKSPLRGILKICMSYSSIYLSIIALLDAELDRLQRARILLTTPIRSVGFKTHASAKGQSRRAQLLESVPTTNPSTSPTDVSVVLATLEHELVPRTVKAQEPITVQRLTPRVLRRRAPRFQSSQAGSDSKVSALRGTVPGTPIFVSAEQLSQKRVQDKAFEAVVAPVNDMPTAEMLARRWLASSLGR